ncbi:uncharacterized protein BP01DRAFT_353777 [Aspergillus saccharolyticus JOP 1030-1]|uniref:Uncharacterized protein n=1 Tax=Aspergillus saccharolyticus JOP 1030-1 TaxID=1450539 RepID=A0A318ZNT3_9EURO|nr:hypothetical protein BP01DRAFT_353777 [Aspergillus saccharolyticus JOP 1030-1]PYH48637.1 hypothetical protein BP01DRAFT_353777 [Aspergillus saccharolyticus JOP 1030-1]
MVTLHRLPLYAGLRNNRRVLSGSARAARAPHARIAFSTSRLCLDEKTSSKDAPGQGAEPKHWEYDFTFQTQMSKIVFIAGLALVGSLGWYRDARGWWTGVADEGEV